MAHLYTVQFYSRGMAKRLLLDQSQSMDAEESMLNRLKVCTVCLWREAMSFTTCLVYFGMCLLSFFLQLSDSNTVEYVMFLTSEKSNSWPLLYNPGFYLDVY